MEPPKYLFKHCPQKFLPKKGRKFRVGTLSSFRQEENGYVADADEGLFSLHLRFNEKVPVSVEWINAVTMNTSPFSDFPWLGPDMDVVECLRLSKFLGEQSGGAVHTTQNIEILDRSGDSVTLVGELIVKLEQFDAFIFCMSEGNEIGSIIHDPEYDSVWKLPQANVAEFSRRMAHALMQEVYKNGLGVRAEQIGIVRRDPFKAPVGAKKALKTLRGRVQYESKIVEVTKSGSPTYDEVYRWFNLASFIKPEVFHAEQEFRFYARPIYETPGSMISIPNKLSPLFIDCDGFLELISY